MYTIILMKKLLALTIALIPMILILLLTRGSAFANRTGVGVPVATLSGDKATAASTITETLTWISTTPPAAATKSAAVPVAIPAGTKRAAAAGLIAAALNANPTIAVDWTFAASSAGIGTGVHLVIGTPKAAAGTSASSFPLTGTVPPGLCITSGIDPGAEETGCGEPPVCFLSASGTGFIQVTFQDFISGLVAINVLLADNATVSIPSFSVPTNDPVVVTATKILPDIPSRVKLEGIDAVGNVTTCDPVLTLVVREKGKPVSQTLTGIAQTESKITITNGTPGLSNLSITVNGKRFEAAGLKDNEVRTVDVSSAMKAGDSNTITLDARGKPGGSAAVVIHD